MGEDTCYAGALGGSIGLCVVGGGRGGLTVDGPAPMRMARPAGAMVRLGWSGVENSEKRDASKYFTLVYDNF